MKPLTRIINEALRLPSDAAAYELSLQLEERSEGLVVLETEDSDFDPVGYCRAGHASLFVVDGTHAQVDLHWDGQDAGAYLKPRNALCEVLWRGQRFHLLTVTLDDGCVTRHLIVAPNVSLGERFFTEVCRWNDTVEDSILVFRNGRWHRDERLRASIAGSTFENLVLAEDLRERLEQDVLSFFASKEHYERYGVAWKRGVLLLGPPGNGKTHAIKALVRAASAPTLYVRNFNTPRGTAQQAMQEVFRRARNAAPCLLVLEDLDSLVEPKALSYFLNEMDGFAPNQGILTLATTNHPERLDPALTERPSRFDRKILFPLPGPAERRRFLQMLQERWEPEMRLAEQDFVQVVVRSEGFTFAYLKELCVSSMVSWMAAPIPGTMGATMLPLVDALRGQMAFPLPPPADEEEEE